MPDDSKPQTSVKLTILGSAASVVVVAVYLVFVALQWRDPAADNTVWARRQELLTGLEALAFAGIGALLGTTVQRQVTRKAEQHAADAESEAARNRRDAEKGRALHAAIETRRTAIAASQGRGGADEDVIRGTARAARPDPLDELAELADRYDQDR